MSRFASVEEYFKKIWPEGLKYSGDRDKYWQGLFANTLTKEDIVNWLAFFTVYGWGGNDEYMAGLLVLLARDDGDLPNPG